MNEQASRAFEKEGGYDLIGKNVWIVIPNLPDQNLKVFMPLPVKMSIPFRNTERNGWFTKHPISLGVNLAGLVELGLDLPEDMPHFNRDVE